MITVVTLLSVSILFNLYFLFRIYKQKGLFSGLSNKMHAMFDQTFQFIGLLATDGKLLEANKTSLQFVQAESKDVLNKPFWESPWWRHDPDQITRLKDDIEKASKGMFVRERFTHLSSDNQLHYFDFSIKPITDLNGEVQYLIAEGRDISDMIKTEQKQKETTQALRYLFDENPDPVWVIENGYFVECNKKAVELLGYDSKEDLLKVHPSELSPKYQADGKSSYEKANEMMLEAKDKGSHRFEWTHLTKTGKELPVEVTLSYFVRNNCDAFYCSWRDIGHRLDHELEREIMITELRDKTAKFKVANLMKTRFMKSVGHKMITPLNTIIGLSKTLIDSPENNPKDLLPRILVSSENLLKLIYDILDLTNLETEQTLINNKDFDCKSEFDTVYKVMKSQAEDKELKLEMFISDKLPEKLNGDIRKIKQCVCHLIDNAIKFTQNGHVTCEVMPDVNSDFFLISVRDSGAGIPKSQQDKLFGNLMIIDDNFTRASAGIGIGLIIVKKTVEAMEGTVSFTSEENVGSCFTLSIPLKKTITSLDKESKQSESKEKPKVLVVDDNEDNLLVVKMMLRTSACELFTADSGKMALELIKQHDFSIIFMDLQMPEMDGFEARKKIASYQAENKTKASKIYSLSAHVMDEENNRCLNEGFDGYLMKPIDKKTLERIIKENS